MIQANPKLMMMRMMEKRRMRLKALDPAERTQRRVKRKNGISMRIWKIWTTVLETKLLPPQILETWMMILTMNSFVVNVVRHRFDSWL
jgi:hypothetical protein